MITSKTTHRVRYAETDQMGYLYHGHYALLYEIGRVEMLRELGRSYATLESREGVMMPVMSMNQRFIRPAHYDEVLTITTTLRHVPEQTITFHFEIHNEQGKLVNGGSIKLCFVEVATQRRVSAPEYLLQIIRPYFE
ncbi:thioesterase family protein [Lewinella sp. JB7]|uniref:acyl-CoA thioesterase n=1 Tax=Lewinella sp. JB7 TaxID=2962887 RepID=UPI0020C9E248|nr:thioesterase family protein [Lewinella sp. JB7]MCP9234955.1 acyl-CoA thioesterase [Lewinella sp. JB7]